MVELMNFLLFILKKNKQVYKSFKLTDLYQLLSYTLKFSMNVFILKMKSQTTSF